MSPQPGLAHVGISSRQNGVRVSHCELVSHHTGSGHPKGDLISSHKCDMLVWPPEGHQKAHWVRNADLVTVLCHWSSHVGTEWTMAGHGKECPDLPGREQAFPPPLASCLSAHIILTCVSYSKAVLQRSWELHSLCSSRGPWLHPHRQCPFCVLTSHKAPLPVPVSLA